MAGENSGNPTLPAEQNDPAVVKFDRPKHTPGPWQVVPANRAQSPWIVGDREGGSIADCEPAGPWMSPEEASANACLIAAAPDLRASLREIMDVLAIHDAGWRDGDVKVLQQAVDGAVFERARAALSKAEGTAWAASPKTNS